jgi:hypothetical protein
MTTPYLEKLKLVLFITILVEKHESGWIVDEVEEDNDFKPKVAFYRQRRDLRVAWTDSYLSARVDSRMVSVVSNANHVFAEY